MTSGRSRNATGGLSWGSGAQARSPWSAHRAERSCRGVLGVGQCRHRPSPAATVTAGQAAVPCFGSAISLLSSPAFQLTSSGTADDDTSTEGQSAHHTAVPSRPPSAAAAPTLTLPPGRIQPSQLMLPEVTPATRLLEKRRQQFEADERLEAAKTTYATQVHWLGGATGGECLAAYCRVGGSIRGAGWQHNDIPAAAVPDVSPLPLRPPHPPHKRRRWHSSSGRRR